MSSDKLRRATPNGVGDVPTELLGPAPNRFVAHHNSKSRQQIFDHSQAERKMEIEPDGMRDHLGGETMTAIEGMGSLTHALRTAR